MRDTIFISHATPADNDFSIWIASRLEMLGYKVWIDKEGLLGGERFWATIQKALDRSIKAVSYTHLCAAGGAGAMFPFGVIMEYLTAVEAGNDTFFRAPTYRFDNFGICLLYTSIR